MMVVGVPRETREGERRIALLPDAVSALAGDGVEVRVESGAGAGIERSDAEYQGAGARIVAARDAWDADLVVKVKELQPSEYPHLRAGSTVFCFHHLPHEPERARALAAARITALAFEMVRDANGDYPILAAMSRIAGRQAIEVATRHLGRAPNRVLVLGSGHAGLAAAGEARRAGAAVTVLTRSDRSRNAALAAGFAAGIATPRDVERQALEADLVVGAVFVPGQPTPRLLPRTLVRRMRRGSMIVDISIDAGGVSETSRPTTHAQPVFIDEAVLHYAVPNMPAAVPAEGAAALSHALLPYVRLLGGRGVARAIRDDAALREGVLIWKGHVCHGGIAAEAGLPHEPWHEAMGAA